MTEKPVTPVAPVQPFHVHEDEDEYKVISEDGLFIFYRSRQHEKADDFARSLNMAIENFVAARTLAPESQCECDAEAQKVCRTQVPSIRPSYCRVAPESQLPATAPGQCAHCGADSVSREELATDIEISAVIQNARGFGIGAIAKQLLEHFHITRRGNAKQS